MRLFAAKNLQPFHKRMRAITMPTSIYEYRRGQTPKLRGRALILYKFPFPQVAYFCFALKYATWGKGSGVEGR